MKKKLESITKKKMVLLIGALLVIVMSSRYIYEQHEIKEYKEWFRLHSYKIYKEWSSIDEETNEDIKSGALFLLQGYVYEGYYKEAPNDEKLKKAQKLYREAMTSYRWIIETEFDYIDNGIAIDYERLSEERNNAERKIDMASDLVEE